MMTITKIARIVGLWAALAFAAHAASITSFTAACYSGGPSLTTCPNGANIVLAWVTSGATTASINQGIGAVSPIASGTYTVPWTLPPSGPVTYTLTVDGGVQSSVTMSFDDDYARVVAWPSVVRSHNFESAIACDLTMTGYGHETWIKPASDGGDAKCHIVQDTAKSVSGATSLKFTIPPLGGADATGTFITNFSPDGSKMFGEGDEFYVQYRAYMDDAFMGPSQNIYLHGTACRARVTLGSLNGSFSVGDFVTQTGRPSNTSAATGTVYSWDSGTGTLEMSNPGIGQWLPNLPVTITHSGTQVATATVTANLGAGSTTCSTDKGTAPKLIMFDPADEPPYPRTNSTGQMPNCIGSHIVTTEDNQRGFMASYAGCAQIGYPGQYTGFTPNVSGGGVLLQNANACTYTNNPSIGVKGNPPCVLLQSNGWMTIQHHVKIGHWYLMAPPGAPVATATFSGGYLTSFNITNPGQNWPIGNVVNLGYNYGDAWNLINSQVASSNNTAVVTCTVNRYGGITNSDCSITNAGNGHYPATTIPVRFPPHAGFNLRRDTLIELWQAAPGQPSQLVESMIDFDLINASASPNDWDGGSGNLAGTSVTATWPPPWPFGKIWATPYMTGRDPNAGPFPTANYWWDNLIVSTKRMPDPGVDIQPPTNLTIDKTNYLSGNVTLSWEANPNSNSTLNQTGFHVQRCAGQMYDCVAAVAGTSWTDISDTIGPTARTYIAAIPNQAQEYTFRIRAQGAANNSAYSNLATTEVRPPINPSAQWVNGQVQLTWTQDDEMGTFSVERCDGVFQTYKNNAMSGESYYDNHCQTAPSKYYGSHMEFGNAWTFPGGGTLPFTQLATGIAGSGKGSVVTWTDTTANSSSSATAANVPYNVQGATWANGTATLTTDGPLRNSAALIGQSITISGVNPSGYNGTRTVTAVDERLISFALASDPRTLFTSGGTATVNGTAYNVTNASWVPGTAPIDLNMGGWSSGVGTLTVSQTIGNPSGIVGSAVVVAGMTPARFNTTGMTITAATSNSISYNIYQDPSYVSGGTFTAPGPINYVYRVRANGPQGAWRNWTNAYSGYYGYSAVVTPMASGSCYIDQQTLPPATAGQSYSQQLSATGCTAGQSWGGWTSCHGLTLNASTGVLSGIPDAAATCGPYTVTYDTGSQALSVTINAAPSGTPPEIITASLPSGMVGSAYSATLSSTGDPTITWTISGAPAWITGCSNVTGSSCTLGGTPTTATTYTGISLTATNSSGYNTRTFSVTIQAAPSPAIRALTGGRIIRSGKH